MASVPSLLDDILANPAAREREFPVCRERIFLAHAAVAPFPARVKDAITRYCQQASEFGQFDHLHATIERETRQHLAALLAANVDEIAFASSTSAALSTVAAGLRWEPGDNVILRHGEFPSNTYPWMNLEPRGVELRWLPRSFDGRQGLDELQRLVDSRTRLVSLSSVDYLTGTPIDTSAIGQFLHQNGVRFCVDAIQSLGAVPCSVEKVDFLAADAHKWLLGPQGCAVLFVRKECQGLLDPPFVGWNSAKNKTDFVQEGWELLESAERYEPGSPNVLGMVGLHAALELLSEIGILAIAKRLVMLRERLITGLQERGFLLVGDSNARLQTGITSFIDPEGNEKQLYAALNGRGIIVSLRQDLDKRDVVRVSPHFYTLEQEIDTLLSYLTTWRKQSHDR